MLTTFGTGVKAPLSMFCKATNTPEATVAPKVPVLTSAHEPMTMVALGAPRWPIPHPESAQPLRRGPNLDRCS